MRMHRPGEFFRRFGASGLIGFGESYMAGDWDSADLTGLLTVFAAHADDLVPPVAAADAHGWPSAASRRTTCRRVRARGATSAATTTCPTT